MRARIPQAFSLFVRAAKPQAAGRRILVVDDNRDSAESLAMFLKITGNETRTAYDGEEAIIAVEQFKPEVVLLDIGLPKLNGYDACHRIRQQVGNKGIVLVALTGWGQEEDRRRSKEAGFDDHMVKAGGTCRPHEAAGLHSRRAVVRAYEPLKVQGRRRHLAQRQTVQANLPIR